MSTDYQPRFVAYATSQGRTPDAQLEHDRAEYPGGKMCGFILWMSRMRRKFKEAHPSAFMGDAIRDQAGWTAFLEKEARA